MTDNTKRKMLLLLGLTILMTMIMAATLPSLEFQPGMPLPRLEHGQVVAAPDQAVGAVSMKATNFVLMLLALVLTGAALYMLYQLFQGADWKLIIDFLRNALLISLGIAALVFLVMLFPNSANYTPVVIPTARPEPLVTSPLGPTPPAILWAVGIGLLVVTVIVMVWVFKPSRQQNAMDMVGLEAKKARDALRTGAGLKDVIIHCYLHMSLALKQEQGIERKEFMTTGEFERLLETAGIPHEPIHQLTRLFDAVRYGNGPSNAADEQLAIQCLEAIMVYSRSAGGAK